MKNFFKINRALVAKKKIFTLAAAVLCSIGMWATITQSATPSSVFTCGTTTASNSQVFDKVSSNTDTILFSPYQIYNSSVTWASYDGAWTSSNSSSYYKPCYLWQDASGSNDNNKTLNDLYGSNNALKDNNAGKLYLKVTNCTAFLFSARRGGGTLTFTAHNIADGETTTNDITKSFTSLALGKQELTGLVASATYIISITNVATSAQSNFFAEIGFVYPHEGSGDDTEDPEENTTAPTLASSTPADGAYAVAKSGNIVLTFSEAIASVDDSKFTLTGATIGTVAIDGSDAKKVNVAYTAENGATVTLAVAAGAVADAAENASAALDNISFVTIATVENLATISSTYNVYFADFVSAAVPSGALIDGCIFSPNGNSYSSGKGTDGTISKLYCVRVKSDSQDALAFKVGSPCTLIVYGDRITDRAPFINDKKAAKSDGDNSIDGVATATDGNKGYATYDIPSAGTYYIIGTGDNYLAGLQFTDFCNPPANPLVLSSDAAATVYVGDEITFSTIGGNEGTITIAGANEETITDGKWTATVGEHTFTATQAKNGDYCAQESEALVFNVVEKTPVTAVTVAGETSTYVGDILTYTATAANATAYEWYINDEKQGSDSAKLIITAAKGSYSIVCKARNNFNAADAWISSEPVALTVIKGSGTIISVTRNETVLNGVTGLIGGTAEKNTQDNGKLGSDGHYWKLTLAKGNFLVGDTVIVNVSTAAGSGVVAITSDKAATDVLGSLDNVGVVGDNKVVLTKGGVNTIWLSRVDAINKWNGVVDAISVIRPKEVKSTSEVLKAVTIEEEELDIDDFDEDNVIALETSYIDAPTIVFTKTVTTTYDDDTNDGGKDVDVEVLATEEDGKWQAQAEINGITYTITAVKQSSFVVTYKEGETVLGTENVAVNGHPANYAQYQSKQLATFNGWYSDAALTTAVADMSAEVITAAKTYYAKFENKYATSINIEQYVLDNKKGETTTNALLSLLGTKNFATNISYESGTNELDSLNDSKGAKRNYAYLGLKVKTSGALLNFRLAAGSVLKMKFGNVGTTPKISINGSDYANMTITDDVYTHTAEAEELISFKTADAKAVVLKQIAIDEELANVVYDITCAATTNGTVACGWALAVPGETVALTVTPATGYAIASVTYNNTVIVADETTGKYSFTMPAANVTVTATFSDATALDNTDADQKAVKRIVNGQLIIEKDGKLFNIIGGRIR